jgi:hypothetical protein
MATALAYIPQVRSGPTPLHTSIATSPTTAATPSSEAPGWWGLPCSRAIVVIPEGGPTPPLPAGSLLERLVGAWSLVRHAPATPVVSRVAEAGEGEPAPRLSALEALDAVRQELGLTIDDVARITGIGRTTFHYWRRTGAEPRPSTVRSLWRLYALVMAIVRARGHEAGLGWLCAGTPSPLDRLLAGEINRVEDLSSGWLFDQPSIRRAERSVASEEEPGMYSVPATAPARRSGRKPARVSPAR